MTTKTRYDIAIIGAGSGGLVVASAAASLGAKVLLVENRKMGGDCLNYGCVPSKTFLKSAHLAAAMRKADNYGFSKPKFDTSLKDIMQRVKSVIAEIEPHDSKERFEGLGVDVKFGKGKLVSQTEISIDGEIYQTKKIVVSTGSSAMVPPIKGLDTVRYRTNEDIFELETLPKRLVVLGAGPIGLELGQGFAHLGSEVSVVDRLDKLFVKDEPEASPIMEKQLERDNVKLYLSSEIKEITKQGDEIVVKISTNQQDIDIVCDELLVALGRTPNTKDIGLEQVGVKTDKRGFIEVNDHLQTNIKNIYACGDVRGKFLFTHAAGYEAGIVVKNALIFNMFKTSYHNMAWTTYTIPQVAHVGLLEEQAKQLGIFKQSYILPISANDRAKADDDREGYAKVIIDNKGVVVGGSIVSDKAGDLLPLFSMMVSKKMKLSSAMSLRYQYPIQSEIISSLALIDFKNSAKPWQMKLLKRIVTR